MELYGIQTTAFAALFLVLGYLIQNRIKFLKKCYVPAPFIGGMLFCIISLILKPYISFTPLYSITPIFVAGFFASIGLRVNNETNLLFLICKKNIANRYLYQTIYSL